MSHETLIQDEDFSALSLPDKLSHKVWKARLLGYEELHGRWKHIESPSDPEFKKYADYTKCMCSDTNAAALDSGYNALLLFINSSDLAVKQRKELLPLIIEKGLVATKSTTKAKALEALLSFVFIDQSDPVVDELIVFFDSKQPKLVAASISAICEIVKAYGIPPVQCKHLFKQLLKIFSHTDKSVRAEAQKLAIEVYRWIGQALLPFLEALKPIQRKELNDAFAQLTQGMPTPERYLRSHTAQATAVPANALAEACQAKATDRPHSPLPLESIDPFECAEPVHIISKIPANFEELVSSANWKERKEALDTLLPILRVVRIAEAKYGELVSQLAKKISDTNVNIVVAAANCIEALARGLRAGFSPYQSQVVPGLLDRLKEKKNTVIDALRSCLDAIFDHGQLADLKESIVAALAHKNPQIKSETLLWLARALKKLRAAPLRADVQALCEPLLRCFDDSTNDVREAAFEVFACLLKMVGEKALGATIEKIEKLKMAKIQEYADKTQVVFAVAVSAAASKSFAPGSQAAKAGGLAAKLPALGPASVSVPTIIAAKPSASARPPPVAKKPASSSSAKPAAARPTDAPPSLTLTDEQAEDQIFSLVSPGMAAELVDPNWKVRLAGKPIENATLVLSLARDMALLAIESFLNLLDSALRDAHTEAVTRSLLRKPGFKDSNLQVLSKLIEALSKALLRETSASVVKGSVSLIVPALLDKMSDAKLRKPASDLLLDVSEKVSPQFVLSQVYEPLKSHKSPKVATEGIKWIQAVITEFGMAGIQSRPLVDTLKCALGQSNAAVRSSAVSALGTLYAFVGADLRAALGDLSSGLVATMDAEFAKTSSEQPPKPMRHYSATGSKAESTLRERTGVSATAESEQPEPCDDQRPLEDAAAEDLVPRADISALLTPALIQGIGDTNWKVRKESMDQIIAAIEGANRKILANVGSDLIAELKGRLGDTNRNLTCLALDVISLLAISAGKALEKSLRPLYGPMLQTLSDNKPQVRAAVLKALDSAAAMCSAGFQGILVEAGPALALDSPCLRKDLAGWITLRLVSTDKAKAPSIAADVMDVLREATFLAAVAHCASDRSAEVRKSASALLHAIADHVGGSALIQARVKDVKPALIPVLASVFESYSSKSSALPSKALVGDASAARTACLKTPALSLPKPMPGAKGTTALPSTGSASTLSSSVPIQLSLTAALAGSKSGRAEKDRGHMKFVFDSALGVGGLAGGSSAAGPGSSVPGSYGGRKDLVDHLKESMEPFLSKTTFAGLFSDDFKEQLLAVSSLDDFLLPYSASSAEELSIHPAVVSKAVLAASDLYIKYTAVRLVDSTNATLIVKCLDVFEKVCLILEQSDYQWTEYEASCIIPYLVLRLGDPKEALRARVKALLPRVAAVYPISKFVSNYLVEALKSTKIIRLKLEIVEEIHALAEKVPMCDLSHPPSKLILLMTAMYFGEKDGGVRHGALKVLQAAVANKGDALDASSLPESSSSVSVADVLKWCSAKFAPKEISLLEEKLKKAVATTTAAASVPVALVPATSQTLQSAAKVDSPARSLRRSIAGALGSPLPARLIDAVLSPHMDAPSDSPIPAKKDKEFSLDLDKLNLPTLSTKAGLPLPAEPAVSGASESVSEPMSLLSSRLAASSRAFYSDSTKISSESIRLTLDVILSNIASEERSLANQGLALLETRLPTPASLMSSPHELFLSEQSGLVCSALIGRFEYCLTAELSLLAAPAAHVAPPYHFPALDREASWQLASRLVANLVTLFLNRKMAVSVDPETLGRAFQLVIAFLVLDLNSEKEKERLTALNKHANILLIKILEHADKNALYGSLLSVLKDCSRKLLFSAEFSEAESKCTDLVMKCLWRLTRSLQGDAHSGTVQLKPLIRSLHEFLSLAQSHQWKQRATEGRPPGELPLRTVKTMLHELAVVLGDAILPLVEEALGTTDWESTAVTGYLRFILERRRTMDEEGSHASPMTGSSDEMPGLANPMHPRASMSLPRLSVEAAGQPTATLHTAELSEAEMHARLESIFKLVTDKNHSKQGLTALFEFKETHPRCVPILDSFLERTGGFFRGYISRGLSTLAEEKRASLIMPSTLAAAVPSSPSRMSTARPTMAAASAVAAPIEPDAYRQKLEKMQALFQHAASSKHSDIEKENQETLLSAEPNIFAVEEAAAAQFPSSAPAPPPASEVKREESNFSALKERLKKIKEPNLLE